MKTLKTIGIVLGVATMMLMSTCTISMCAIDALSTATRPHYVQSHSRGNIQRPRVRQQRNVSRNHFEWIEPGMTLRQVQSVVGNDGEQLSYVEMMDVATEIRMWRNHDGSNMNVTFQDGRMIAKAQFGL